MKKIKRTNKPLFISKGLIWILDSIFMLDSSHRLIKTGLISLHTSLEKWNRSMGPVWTAERVKEMRLAVHRNLLGMDRLTNPSFRSRPNGLPEALSKELRLGIIRKDKLVVRTVLTVLSLTRLLMGGKRFDSSSITEESRSIEFNELYLIPRFLKFWNLSQNPDYFRGGGLETEFQEFHQTMKKGPNGPALASSAWDWRSLEESMKKNMALLGGPVLSWRMEFMDRINNSDIADSVFSIFCPKPKNIINSKISLKRDKETKTRPFAILDYWSQTSLRSLHNNLFKLLRKIGPDKTFDQTQGLLDFKPDPGHHYHSVDLSSATDRFPVTLQQSVLSYLIGAEKAQAWRSLMCDRDFHVENTTVRYKCGQPMGAYSSWATFALTHHFVVFWAASRAGIANFQNYKLLGDDIVIGNDLVASSYKAILCELGVEYSFSKTLTSKTGYEFAKRLIYAGEEWSPFPSSGLMSVVKSWPLLYEFFRSAVDRGFNSIRQASREPDFYYSLLQAHDFGHRLSSSLSRRCALLASMPRNEDNIPEVAIKFFKNLSRFFPIYWSCNLSNPSLLSIGNRHCETLFTKHTAKAAKVSMDCLDSWRDSISTVFSGHRDYSSEISNELFMSSNLFPVVFIMSKAARQSLASLSKPQEIKEEELIKIWESINSPRPFVMPPSQGIVPERMSEQVAKSRGHFAISLVSHICDYHKGKEPERILVHHWVQAPRIFYTGQRPMGTLGDKLRRRGAYTPFRNL